MAVELVIHAIRKISLLMRGQSYDPITRIYVSGKPKQLAQIVKRLLDYGLRLRRARGSVPSRNQGVAARNVSRSCRVSMAEGRPSTRITAAPAFSSASTA